MKNFGSSLKLLPLLALVLLFSGFVGCKDDSPRVVDQVLLDITLANAAFETTVQSAAAAQVIDETTTSELAALSRKIETDTQQASLITRNKPKLDNATKATLLGMINELIPEITHVVEHHVSQSGSPSNQQRLRASLDVIKLSLLFAQAQLTK